MIDLSTVKELRALRLPGMARELESQLEEPQRYKALSFSFIMYLCALMRKYIMKEVIVYDQVP